jgi:hypothetical protein
MNRYLSNLIANDLARKMVLVTGPRQVGKTTLARALGDQFSNPLYLNYDQIADRLRIQNSDWPSTHGLVVLEELHAMPQWKAFLKGVFDTKPATQALMVTGSARLDTFRQAGESLAGRYFRWRLHPFSVREFLPQVSGPDQALETLMRFGGFPEPLFEGTESGRRRWQNQYFTDLVREDVLEFSRIHEVRAMRQLVELLRRRTGSPLSFESLGRDLGISAKTARSYVQILEALHIVFLITPYHRNVARALAKAPKLYFYDWAYLEDSQTDSSTSGARLENLVASHLLKHAQFMSDSDGTPITLHYLKTTSGKEVDFVLANDKGEPTHFIEVKLSDAVPGFAIRELQQTHPQAKAVQLVMRAPHGFDSQGVQVRPAAKWLAELAA